MADNRSQFLSVWARPQWRWALAAAVASDALSFGLQAISLGLAEPVQLVVDVVTAIAIFIALGFRWGFAVPLLVEALPIAAAFPTWTLAVLAYSALDRGTGAPPTTPPGPPDIDVRPDPPGETPPLPPNRDK